MSYKPLPVSEDFVAKPGDLQSLLLTEDHTAWVFPTVPNIHHWEKPRLQGPGLTPVKYK